MPLTRLARFAALLGLATLSPLRGAREGARGRAGVQLAQAYPLPSLCVEIPRREPALEGSLARRPFAVEDGVIRRVAAAALGDHVLPERAFVNEAVAQGGPARRCVEHIALPFVAPVAERLEGVAREQVLRLGTERRALQRRRIEDVADLDHAHGRADLHQRRDADGLAGPLDDRIGIGIVELHAAGEPFGEGGEVRERAIGHVGPDVVVALDGLPQARVVTLSQPFDVPMATLEHDRGGALRRRGVDRRADRLPGDGMRLGRARHRFFASSRKKPLSSALAMEPARLSNFPAVAMSRAARTTAVQATRASVPPRLMRRTPSEARSFTVSSVALDIRKFTGFGATAFTTAAICSRVLMPGA